jgi:hypothetical protein
MPRNVTDLTETPFSALPAASDQASCPNHSPERFSLDEGRALGDYVTPEQLSKHLGISVRTLSRWHARRIGPPRCSVGKLILYRIAAVRTWLTERETVPVALGTRQAGARRK